MDNSKAALSVKEIKITIDTRKNGPVVANLKNAITEDVVTCEVHELDVLQALYTGIQALSLAKAHPSLVFHVLANVDTSATPHTLRWMRIDTHPLEQEPNSPNSFFFSVKTASVEHGEHGSLIAILTDAMTGEEFYCNVYGETLKQALYAAIGILGINKIDQKLGPHVLAEANTTERPYRLRQLILQSQG